MMDPRIQRIQVAMTEDSSGRILATLYVPPGMGAGKDRFVIELAPDVDSPAAVALACNVVRPILSREGFTSTPFEMRSRGGLLPLATSATPCP